MSDKTLEEQYKDLILFGLNYKKEELLQKAKGKKVIHYGSYPYSIFNVCFLHDMLGQILQVLYEGYIPVIDLVNREDGWCNWTDFFEQPFYEFDQKYIASLPVVETTSRVNTLWLPFYDSCYTDYEYDLCCKLYADFAVINEKCFSYIQREYQTILQGKNVLGVLCRGTDFTVVHPKGHPVQPELEDVLKDVEKMKRELNCDYIYVASEEERIVAEFEERFSGKILINQRHYYDDEYYERKQKEDKVWIEDILLEKGDERFIKSLEYLSSLVLLSACKGLVAGNCGGSDAALFLNGKNYEKHLIYNLGFYE